MSEHRCEVCGRTFEQAMHLRVHMTSHEPDAEAAREQNAALRELEAEERALAEAAREYNAARTLRVGENHAAREAQSDQHRGRARGPAPRQWSLRRLHTTKGWTRYTDPASGHEYLYNDTTGESRWVEDAAPREQQAFPPAGRPVTQMSRQQTVRWASVQPSLAARRRGTPSAARVYADSDAPETQAMDRDGGGDVAPADRRLPPIDVTQYANTGPIHRRNRPDTEYMSTSEILEKVYECKCCCVMSAPTCDCVLGCGNCECDCSTCQCECDPSGNRPCGCTNRDHDCDCRECTACRCCTCVCILVLASLVLTSTGWYRRRRRRAVDDPYNGSF